MQKARVKALFPKYRKSPMTIKSLINFIMKNSKIWVESYTSYWEWEAIHITVTEATSVKDGKYTFTATNAPEESTIALVNGTMTDSINNKTISFTNEICSLDEDDKFVIKTNSDGYDTINLDVLPLPYVDANDTYLCITPNTYSHSTGYSICIPFMDCVNRVNEPSALPARSEGNEYTHGAFMHVNTSYTGGEITTCHPELNGEAGNNIKLVFEYISDEDNKVTLNLYNGNERIGGASFAYPSVNDNPKIRSLTATRLSTKIKLSHAQDEPMFYLGEYIRFLNYLGDNGYMTLNFTDTDTIELPLSGGTDADDTIYKADSGVVETPLNKKRVNSAVSLFKDLLVNSNEIYLEDALVNIPVTLEIQSDGKEPIGDDVLPYALLYSGDVEYYAYAQLKPIRVASKLAKVSNPISYQLKTDAFTIVKSTTDPETEETTVDKINVYYRLGVVALDGKEESSNELAALLKENSCFTITKSGPYNSGSNGKQIVGMKPTEEHYDDETYYSLSDVLVRYNKVSAPEIIVKSGTIGNSDPRASIAHSMMYPIIKINTNNDSRTLDGLMYMQLFNADDNSQINEDFMESENIEVEINNESALDKDILFNEEYKEIK